MLSESKYLADFLVGFLGKRPQTLLIPIYSTTILYDKITSLTSCNLQFHQAFKAALLLAALTLTYEIISLYY